VDLIDVRRLERILVEALEVEAVHSQATSAPPLPGRFAKPASAFSRTNGQIILAHQQTQPQGQ
jgi:hypothetical protein